MPLHSFLTHSAKNFGKLSIGTCTRKAWRKTEASWRYCDTLPETPAPPDRVSQAWRTSTRLRRAKLPRYPAFEAAMVEVESVELAASGQSLIHRLRLGPLMPLSLIEN